MAINQEKTLQEDELIKSDRREYISFGFNSLVDFLGELFLFIVPLQLDSRERMNDQVKKSSYSSSSPEGYIE